MTKKKLLMLVLLIFIVCIGAFSIYKSTYVEEYNFVALGDSLASGRNPYGVDDYGYTDYVRDFLSKEGKLNSYTSYAVSGYTIKNLSDDIINNRTITVNEKEIGIKKALRESDIVTISIGANNLLYGMNISNFGFFLSNLNKLKINIDNTFNELESLMVEIKKYAKNDIVVVGYYNPFPYLEKYSKVIDEIIDYTDKKYQQLCDKYNIYYVQISDVIRDNKDCLPNPLDIHPNQLGYKKISEKVIDAIKYKVFE